MPAIFHRSPSPSKCTECDTSAPFSPGESSVVPEHRAKALLFPFPHQHFVPCGDLKNHGGGSTLDDRVLRLLRQRGPSPISRRSSVSMDSEIVSTISRRPLSPAEFRSPAPRIPRFVSPAVFEPGLFGVVGLQLQPYTLCSLYRFILRVEKAPTGFVHGRGATASQHGTTPRHRRQRSERARGSTRTSR